MSVTVNNSSIHYYAHLGNHVPPTHDMTPGLKSFTMKIKLLNTFCLHSLFYMFITYSCSINFLCFVIEGGFYFEKEPEAKIYFLKGTNASFEWKYIVVDRAAEFQFVKFAARNITTLAFSLLMYEQADSVVKFSSRIPPSYVGRVERRGQATLAITSVIFEDSTIYRCRLEAKDGGYNESYIELVVIGMAYYQLLIRSAFKNKRCLSAFKRKKKGYACQNSKSCEKDLLFDTCSTDFCLKLKQSVIPREASCCKAVSGTSL